EHRAPVPELALVADFVVPDLLRIEWLLLIRQLGIEIDAARLIAVRYGAIYARLRRDDVRRHETRREIIEGSFAREIPLGCPERHQIAQGISDLIAGVAAAERQSPLLERMPGNLPIGRLVLV